MNQKSFRILVAVVPGDEQVLHCDPEHGEVTVGRAKALAKIQNPDNYQAYINAQEVSDDRVITGETSISLIEKKKLKGNSDSDCCAVG